jgi:hypothetical protein
MVAEQAMTLRIWLVSVKTQESQLGYRLDLYTS